VEFCQYWKTVKTDVVFPFSIPGTSELSDAWVECLHEIVSKLRENLQRTSHEKGKDSISPELLRNLFSYLQNIYSLESVPAVLAPLLYPESITITTVTNSVNLTPVKMVSHFDKTLSVISEPQVRPSE